MRADRSAGEFMTLLILPSFRDAIRVAFGYEMQRSPNFPRTHQSIGAALAGWSDIGDAPGGVAGQ
jgi:hypothetical protein